MPLYKNDCLDSIALFFYLHRFIYTSSSPYKPQGRMYFSWCRHIKIHHIQMTARVFLRISRCCCFLNVYIEMDRLLSSEIAKEIGATSIHFFDSTSKITLLGFQILCPLPVSINWINSFFVGTLSLNSISKKLRCV